MTLARWLAALALAIAAGCSVNHHSGDFVCSDQVRCADDRICVDGFCVLADSPAGDAGVCPSVCTSCSAGQNTCTIDCAVNGGCTAKVACPDGWSCNVLCSTQNACRNGVVCPDDQPCTITCTGFRSCQGVTCGAGRCSVDCAGGGSCRDIVCGPSCACDVGCGSVATCSNVSCDQGCDAPLGGCSTLGAGCNTCK